MTPAAGVVVDVGELRLAVPPGHAADQRVAWPRREWAGVLRQRASGSADEVLGGLDGVVDAHGCLTRRAITRLAEAGNWPAAYAGVVAWGAGNRWGRFYRNLCRGLERGDAERLVRSWEAAPAGLNALWSAHFAAPPLGLGRPSYGSKWLHLAGWGRTPEGEPGPLVYDERVWRALKRCAGFAALRSPAGSHSSRRESWITWCALADGAVRDTGVDAADLERAVFGHAGACERSRRGTTHPCSSAATGYSRRG